MTLLGFNAIMNRIENIVAKQSMCGIEMEALEGGSY